MNSLKINRTSWHYRLIAVTSSGMVPTDICAYTRAMLVSIFMILMLLFGTSCVLFATADFGAWIAASIVSGLWIEPGFGFVFWGLIFCLGLVIAFAMALQVLFEKGMQERPVLRAMVESVRNKVCVPLDFK